VKDFAYAVHSGASHPGMGTTIQLSGWNIQQSLAADGAIACFSNNFSPSA
jgi:hypothetical protein